MGYYNFADDHECVWFIQLCIFLLQVILRPLWWFHIFAASRADGWIHLSLGMLVVFFSDSVA